MQVSNLTINNLNDHLYELSIHTNEDFFYEFLEWAEDKISVVWAQGIVCQNASIRDFIKIKEKNMTVLEFLNKILEWVNKKEGMSGTQSIFLFNDSYYDEYKEETFTPSELMDYYYLCMNFN
jgi:hypothetical protein